MSDDTDGGCIDGRRSCSLYDVGGGNVLAATLVGADYTILALLDTDHIRDGTPIDRHCREAVHEQLGPLPLEIARRVAIANRTHRCGHPTESGRPCRITVTHAGDACRWHSKPTERNTNV